MAPEASVTDAPKAVAVIDIGSSAIRLLIAEVGPDGATRTVETASKGVRLGRNVFTKGGLGPKTIEAACEVLADFRRIMTEHGVGQVRAVATSAVREAGNRDTFLDRIALRTGLDVEVLDAAEENRLTYVAVRAALAGLADLELEDTLMVEVGGGSADLALMQRGEPAHSGTYALGAIRLRETLSGLAGSQKAWVKALQRHISNVVSDIRREIPLKGVHRFVGIGGDLRFAANQLVGDAPDVAVRAIPRDEFLDFSRRIARMKTERLVARFELPYTEAETLGPALLAYRQLLRVTQAPEVLVPRVSLRDALLADLARAVRGDAEADFRRQVLASADALAEKYQANLRHARCVSRFCDRLFEDLRPLHRLGEREKTLLLAAAVLHDVGLFVSLQAHHKHSEYLIRASQLFGLGRAEREIVACVARYHRRATPRPTHPSFTALDRRGRLTVSKLAAILRLANALDRDHSGNVHEVRARPEEERWVLEVEAAGELDVERFTLAQRADLFREVFGVDVELRAGSGS
jgi:exopolyphosphatase/guanosine-5'-triphosphate,3'-diphosphate pyrophosphatase